MNILKEISALFVRIAEGGSWKQLSEKSAKLINHGVLKLGDNDKRLHNTVNQGLKLCVNACEQPENETAA